MPDMFGSPYIPDIPIGDALNPPAYMKKLRVGLSALRKPTTAEAQHEEEVLSQVERLLADYKLRAPARRASALTAEPGTVAVEFDPSYRAAATLVRAVVENRDPSARYRGKRDYIEQFALDKTLGFLKSPAGVILRVALAGVLGVAGRALGGVTGLAQSPGTEQRKEDQQEALEQIGRLPPPPPKVVERVVEREVRVEVRVPVEVPVVVDVTHHHTHEETGAVTVAWAADPSKGQRAAELAATYDLRRAESDARRAAAGAAGDPARKRAAEARKAWMTARAARLQKEFGPGVSQSFQAAAKAGLVGPEPGAGAPATPALPPPQPAASPVAGPPAAQLGPPAPGAPPGGAALTVEGICDAFVRGLLAGMSEM
ncbi:MAG: hypothetical protein HYU66_07640 [Armatimonadetes bacterium]|nr:hypothetical protein [Armatimonadota bacterium]